MRNIEFARTGTKLTITIDLAAKGELSASGKTTVLASTHGNVDVPGCTDVKIGVNVFAFPGYDNGAKSVVAAFTPRRRPQQR